MVENRLKMVNYVMWLVILGAICTVTDAEDESTLPHEKRLLNKLLANYDPIVRPVSNYSEIINISFTLSLQQIVDLDEKNQVLATSMYMTWGWNDTFMRWNPADYGGISVIRLPAKKVWKPDILIYNSAVDAFDQMLQTNVLVSSDGYMEWLPPGLFKTTCDVDIKDFPFDEQNCKIKFGAWTHHGGLVDLILHTEYAATDSYTESGEWDLISMKGKRTAVSYDCCPDPFVDITYTIKMRRRTLFYSFNLILPCLLVCSLTILVFVLPADSGERITLGITVLLALVVFLQLVADNLPPTDVIPLLGRYFACSIVMVTTSVVCSVISLVFHHTSAANSNEMPQWIRVVFLQFLAKFLRMKRPGENSFRRQFLDQKKRQPSTIEEEYPLIQQIGTRLENWNQNSNDLPVTDLRKPDNELKKILEEIKFITKSMHNDDDDERSALEWQFAATVLDTFCMYFFIIYFILTTFLTLGLAPGVLVPLPEDE